MFTPGQILTVHAGPGRTTTVFYAGPGVCRRGWRGCKQRIVWAETRNKKRQPIDPTPDEQGIYMPHHATCPKAAHFRDR